MDDKIKEMDGIIKEMLAILIENGDTVNALKMQTYWDSFDGPQKAFIKCVYDFGRMDLKGKVFKSLL